MTRAFILILGFISLGEIEAAGNQQNRTQKSYVSDVDVPLLLQGFKPSPEIDRISYLFGAVGYELGIPSIRWASVSMAIYNSESIASKEMQSALLGGGGKSTKDFGDEGEFSTFNGVLNGVLFRRRNVRVSVGSSDPSFVKRFAHYLDDALISGKKGVKLVPASDWMPFGIIASNRKVVKGRRYITLSVSPDGKTPLLEMDAVHWFVVGKGLPRFSTPQVTLSWKEGWFKSEAPRKVMAWCFLEGNRVVFSGPISTR